MQSNWLQADSRDKVREFRAAKHERRGALSNRPWPSFCTSGLCPCSFLNNLQPRTRTLLSPLLLGPFNCMPKHPCGLYLTSDGGKASGRRRRKPEKWEQRVGRGSGSKLGRTGTPGTAAWRLAGIVIGTHTIHPLRIARQSAALVLSGRQWDVQRGSIYILMIA